MTDSGLAQRLTLAGVVATVDAVNGPDTLARQPESLKQVAVADRLLLTKTDLVGSGEAEVVAGRLAALNPAAVVLTASFGEVASERLFDTAADDPRSGLLARVAPGADDGHPHHDHGEGQQRHDAGLTCFAILREPPIRAVTLTLLLEVLAEHCGADLLRLKGIVNIAESPERPAVIHGVQHVFHPPAWLERWPSADRRSRLVFIGRNLRQAWVEALIEALEAEVADVTGR
jgi:G3E family GTPase